MTMFPLPALTSSPTTEGLTCPWATPLCCWQSFSPCGDRKEGLERQTSVSYLTGVLKASLAVLAVGSLSMADIQIWFPHWCLCEFSRGPIRGPPTSPFLPSAPILGDSPRCSLWPGSTFLAATSLGWDVSETTSTWLSSTASLWSRVKSHIHYQMLNVGHGRFCTLSLLSALPLPPILFSAYQIAQSWTSPSMVWADTQLVNEERAGKTSDQNLASQGWSDFPEFSPPDSYLLIGTGSRWQRWRLEKQAQFSCFLINPERNVWFLFTYYLLFGPWRVCPHLWIPVVNFRATKKLPMNILFYLLNARYYIWAFIYMITYEPQNCIIAYILVVSK